MPKEEFYDQEFLSEKNLIKGEYEACMFENCELAEANLERYDFIDCEFVSCDLSGALITNSSFKNVSFIDCKIMGVHFDTANPFLLELSFENCQLQMSVFYGMKLGNTQFLNCNLSQVDFADANLQKAVFRESNLNAAVFDGANLSNSDFREAVNYQINPLKNKIENAKFSKEQVFGLLSAFKIVVE